MFIHNATSLDVSLARGHVTDEVAVAAVVVCSTLRVDGDDLLPVPEPITRGDTDPPADIARLPLWQGVSVTAAGAARGPARAPYVCPILFRIGAAERRLIVFGDRHWERRVVGGLEATAATPFESIELSFIRAFGGGYDLPPGLLPGTDLPHPGVRVAYPLNELGVGFYSDERAANGGPLPNVERPDQLVRRWNDAPVPAGFTPCRELLRWRMTDEAAAIAAAEAGTEAPAARPPSLRVLHHAPPWLIFDDVPAGTPVELRGLGERGLAFCVPPAPAKVTTRAGKARVEIRPRLRALHVDAERRAVRLVHDHSFRYDPRRAPPWIHVANQAREAP